MTLPGGQSLLVHIIMGALVATASAHQDAHLPGVHHRTLPAVARMAFASARDRQRALTAGYDEHVPKPLDLDLLLDAIARIRASRPKDAIQ